MNENKWRNLITASANPQLTQLWEAYQSDCRARGQLEESWEIFTQKAKDLTHPELLDYWRLNLACCEQNGSEIEPFLNYMTRMQQALKNAFPSYNHSRTN
jgi:hypothetical protein